MTTAPQLQQIIGQLNEEELVKLEEYAELLLLRKQQPKQKNLKQKTKKNGSAVQDKMSEQTVPERLKILRQFAGDALYPDMPTNKYDVYDQ